MYDPGPGRWLQEDPLGFGGAMPTCTATSGTRPTNFGNPSGLRLDGMMGAVVDQVGGYLAQGMPPKAAEADGGGNDDARMASAEMSLQTSSTAGSRTADMERAVCS